MSEVREDVEGSAVTPAAGAEPTAGRDAEPAPGQAEAPGDHASEPGGEAEEATDAVAEAPPESAGEEPAGPDPGAAAETEEAREPTPEAQEPVEPPPDPRLARIRFLEAELERREETLREYIKAHKKAQAEFEAFRQRLLRDQEREVAAAQARAVEPMLDVFDNLDRTIEATRRGGDLSTLMSGVELVARQFLQTLETMGLERHDPTGEPFDPATMNALGVIPVTDAADNNKVLITVQPGFRLGEREIRPALVQVGRKMR